MDSGLILSRIFQALPSHLQTSRHFLSRILRFAVAQQKGNWIPLARPGPTVDFRREGESIPLVNFDLRLPRQGDDGSRTFAASLQNGIRLRRLERTQPPGHEPAALVSTDSLTKGPAPCFRTQRLQTGSCIPYSRK